MLEYARDMKSVQAQLEALGLGEKEVKAYLAALSLGTPTAQEIAVKAVIERPTAYVAVEGLMKRGLMSSFKKGKKTYYSAEKPEKLLKLVQAERARLAEREAKLKEVMPELEALISLSVEKPEVKYYEGLEGLEAMKDIFFESKARKIDVVSSIEDQRRVVPEEKLLKHAARLYRSGVVGRTIILSKTEIDAPMINFSSWEFRHLIPPKKIKLGGEIAIFSDYVSLVAYLNAPYGFLLRSAEIADTARMIFDGAWTTARKARLRK